MSSYHLWQAHYSVPLKKLELSVSFKLLTIAELRLNKFEPKPDPTLTVALQTKAVRGGIIKNIRFLSLNVGSLFLN